LPIPERLEAKNSPAEIRRVRRKFLPSCEEALPKKALKRLGWRAKRALAGQFASDHPSCFSL
jgi:hypothetical protein